MFRVPGVRLWEKHVHIHMFKNVWNIHIFQSIFLCFPFCVFCLSWLFQFSQANLSCAFSCSPYLDEDSRNVLILGTFQISLKEKEEAAAFFLCALIISTQHSGSLRPNILHVKVKVLLQFSPLCNCSCDCLLHFQPCCNGLCGSNWKYFVRRCNDSRAQGLWVCQRAHG